MISVLYPIAADGRIILKRVRIGTVLPAPAGEYNFTYEAGEDIESVWQGNFTCLEPIKPYLVDYMIIAANLVTVNAILSSTLYY